MKANEEPLKNFKMETHFIKSALKNYSIFIIENVYLNSYKSKQYEF